MSLDASSAEKLSLWDARRAVCYPRPEDSYCYRLIEELVEAGVEYYLAIGRFSKPGLPLLGSGWAGNVFAALWHGELVAVKALRPDSRRRSVLRECLLMGVASAYGIAPRLFRCTLHALIYRLVEGVTLSTYKPRSSWEGRLILRRLLYKAYLLDRLGIDHGELVRPGGQVLVEESEPWIIDFDSASAKRRPRNLTSLAAGISRLEWAKGLVKPSNTPEVRSLLRAYRENPSLELFERILEAMGL